MKLSLRDIMLPMADRNVVGAILNCGSYEDRLQIFNGLKLIADDLTVYGQTRYIATLLSIFAHDTVMMYSNLDSLNVSKCTICLLDNTRITKKPSLWARLKLRHLKKEATRNEKN